MSIMGDTIHNFVDGVLIAAAFVQGPELGMITAIAIVAHEIPQEVGDFLVLLDAGLSRRAALVFNAASGLAMLLGGLVAYYALQALAGALATLLALAAASMLYVAVADLIPGLHRRPELSASLMQSGLIAAGIATIAAVGALPH